MCFFFFLCYFEVMGLIRCVQVHPTGDANESQRVSHAKGGGEASVVPQKLQEILPERVERDVPNALHDTGDESGLHRK